MLAGLQTHKRNDCCGCEQRVSWCWTEEATLCISRHLGWLAFEIACMILGTAVWWCWQCLMTVGGNWLPHIATPLDVTTVTWYCRHTQDVLHPAESPPETLRTPEWQWTASVFTTSHCTGRYSNLKVSVLSSWRLLLGITLYHRFPQCAAAELWCYLKCVKETTTEIKLGMQVDPPRILDR